MCVGIGYCQYFSAYSVTCRRPRGIPCPKISVDEEYEEEPIQEPETPEEREWWASFFEDVRSGKFDKYIKG